MNEETINIMNAQFKFNLGQKVKLKTGGTGIVIERSFAQFYGLGLNFHKRYGVSGSFFPDPGKMTTCLEDLIEAVD